MAMAQGPEFTVPYNFPIELDGRHRRKLEKISNLARVLKVDSYESSYKGMPTEVKIEEVEGSKWLWCKQSRTESLAWVTRVIIFSDQTGGGISRVMADKTWYNGDALENGSRAHYDSQNSLWQQTLSRGLVEEVLEAAVHLQIEAEKVASSITAA